MAAIIMMIFFILCFATFANIRINNGKGALSVYSKIIIAFIKSSQILFVEAIVALVSIVYILLVCSNHFVIDYYIIFAYNSMLLITLHTLRMSRYPSAIS